MYFNISFKKMLFLFLFLISITFVFAGGGGSTSTTTTTSSGPTTTATSTSETIISVETGIKYGTSHPDYAYFQAHNDFGRPDALVLTTPSNVPTTIDVSGKTNKECSSVVGVTRDSNEYHCIDGFEPALPSSPIPSRTFLSDWVINWGEHCDNVDLAGRSCSLRLGAGYVGSLECDNYEIDESGCFSLFTSSASKNCGNGILDAGEECDFSVNPVGCTSECTLDVIDCSFVETIEEACYCEDGGTGNNKYLTETIDMNKGDVKQSDNPTVTTTGCCGDESNEYVIKMNDFPIYDEAAFSLLSYPDVYACCDNSDDCNYKGVCYNLGEIITPNPRYICGENNDLREALDYNYAEASAGNVKAATVPPMTDPEYNFEVQRTPESYALDKISCNSKDINLPQLWTTISECKEGPIAVGGPGSLKITVIDGATEIPVVSADLTVRFDLYRTGISDDSQFEENRVYKIVTDKTDATGTLVVSNLLGTYYTVVVQVSDGGFGISEIPVRVNYDGQTDVTIKTFRTNACYGCVDYSNNGLCSSACEGISIFPDADASEICDFGNDDIRDACDLVMPGTIVEVADGTGVLRRIECCASAQGDSWDKGTVISPLSANITCPDGQTLINKKSVQSINGEQVSVVVSMCE